MRLEAVFVILFNYVFWPHEGLPTVQTVLAFFMVSAQFSRTPPLLFAKNGNIKSIRKARPANELHRVELRGFVLGWWWLRASIQQQQRNCNIFTVSCVVPCLAVSFLAKAFRGDGKSSPNGTWWPKRIICNVKPLQTDAFDNWTHSIKSKIDSIGRDMTVAFFHCFWQHHILALDLNSLALFELWKCCKKRVASWDSQECCPLREGTQHIHNDMEYLVSD